MSKRISFCIALWLGLQLGAAAAAPRAVVDDARLSKASSEPQNWLAHGGAHPDWYFSGLDKLDVTNVGRLRPAWFIDLDTNRGQEATPLIADGTLYTTTAWSKVLAVDAGTGRVKWQFDPKVPGHASNGKLLWRFYTVPGTSGAASDGAASDGAASVTASSEQAVHEGSVLFARLCVRCHGIGTRSRNVIPDLRRVPPLGDAATWKSIVIDGALEDAGMIGWKRFISAEDAEKIRAYVASQARQLAQP